MGQQRNRRTQEEMLAHYQQQVERLQARIDGREDESSENAVLKKLRKRLRRTNTELKAARVTLKGVSRDDGSGWTRSPIDVKIEQTQNRLASQIETKERAEVFEAKLPFDVERLEALIEAGEAGEDVEFPADLTRLSIDEERTDEEHEAAYIAGENEGEDS